MSVLHISKIEEKLGMTNKSNTITEDDIWPPFRNDKEYYDGVLVRFEEMLEAFKKAGFESRNLEIYEEDLNYKDEYKCWITILGYVLSARMPEPEDFFCFSKETSKEIQKEYKDLPHITEEGVYFYWDAYEVKNSMQLQSLINSIHSNKFKCKYRWESGYYMPSGFKTILEITIAVSLAIASIGFLLISAE